jgi:hypothetical protein
MNRTRRLMLITSTVAMLAGGCTRLKAPPLFEPGSAELQRLRAERFDPYAEIEAGPTDAMESVRPRDFQRPAAEPRRIKESAAAAREADWTHIPATY